MADTTNTQRDKNTATSRTANRGFASMDPERQREIASKGGRAAHRSGNAHQFTPEEARAAGQKSRARARSSSAERMNSN